jgi:hypothetical protein
MNDKEFITAHDELKDTIIKALWDFSDKYFPDRNNFPQSAFIMQSVLTGAVSDVEYQVGKMAPFTNRQIDHICYQIGDWYLMMKPLLEGKHNLGYMKEKLKTMICGEGDE